MPDDLRPSSFTGDIAPTVADGIALTEHPVAPASALFDERPAGLAAAR